MNDDVVVVVVSSQETSAKNEEILKIKSRYLMTCVHPLNDPIDPGC